MVPSDLLLPLWHVVSKILAERLRFVGRLPVFDEPMAVVEENGSQALYRF